MSERFETFTERARKVLSLAQEEAQRFDHTYIGTEHLLLGLIREGSGVAVTVLKNLGVDTAEERRTVETIVSLKQNAETGEIGLTAQAKKAIELAVDEARRSHHAHVGTEHLLIGLLREEDGVAAAVLESDGLSLTVVRQETQRVLSQRAATTPLPAAKPAQAESDEEQHKNLIRYAYRRLVEDAHTENAEERRKSLVRRLIEGERTLTNLLPQTELKPHQDDIEAIVARFNAEAQAVLAEARAEARRFNHSYIGTEHLLLGMLRAEGGAGLSVLNDLGVKISRVRTSIEFIVGRGINQMTDEISLTSRTKKVITLAWSEAQQLGQNSIGAEHLLLGLVAEHEGIAAGVLESQGVKLDMVRQKVLARAKQPQEAKQEHMDEEKPEAKQLLGESVETVQVQPDAATVFISHHPLIQHKLGILRDKETEPKRFREVVHEISTLLAYEATAGLQTRAIKVQTPLAEAECRELSEVVGLVPILRSGIGMVDAFLRMLPGAQVWHIGLYREHDTLQPVQYYNKLPGHTPTNICLVLDPMLATGGSAAATISLLKEWGALRIIFVGLIAAPEGVKQLQSEHPDVPIYLAAVDDHLNEIGYIVPGLGDAGDRQFGTL